MHKKGRKLLRSGFVCKYKGAQKREPEIVSEIECFHSPALDMDYIFFFDMGVIFSRATCCEAGTVRKSADCGLL